MKFLKSFQDFHSSRCC